jgi:hypothetical protein
MGENSPNLVTLIVENLCVIVSTKLNSNLKSDQGDRMLVKKIGQ